MRNIKSNSILIIFTVFIALVFKDWFSTGLISAGDFAINQKYIVESFSLPPYSWSTVGIGSFVLPTSWLYLTIGIPIIIGDFFSIPWIITERLFLLYPLLSLLFISPLFVFKKIFPNTKFYFLASLIFALNTYILMLIGGGQVFLALAYSITPLVFYTFIKTFSKPSFYRSTVLGLTLSLQVAFDLRFAYVTVFIFLIYSVLNISFDKKFIRNNFYSLVLPGVATFLLHSYWIIPTFLGGGSSFQSFGEEYTTSGIIDFFSFARLENSLSLLHPNWPENLFGKVSFMRPEFILIPILAFIPVLTLSRVKEEKQKKFIVFFSALALIGAFLAKGTNDPFGGIYTFLFNNVPGFIMFRDPTKWYLLVAFSYSFLIPFAVSHIYKFLQERQSVAILSFKLLNEGKYLNLHNLFLVAIIFYLSFLIRPALLGELEGAFKKTTIPDEYSRLEKFLLEDEGFYRTFWIPRSQRFSFYSADQPIISADNYFRTNDSREIIEKLRSGSAEEELRSIGVKYVIVPFDSEGEIFLDDRKYSEDLYTKTVDGVNKINWLEGLEEFEKIKVFEVSSPKDHFYFDTGSGGLSYKRVSPIRYDLEFRGVKKGDRLVFSERADPFWVAVSGNSVIKSEPYGIGLNSFLLEKSGNYSVSVYYSRQDITDKAFLVSAISFLILVLIALFRRKNDKAD